MAVPALSPRRTWGGVGARSARAQRAKAMAPAASRLRAEAGFGALPRRALAEYLRLLRLYPVLTKAATRSARRGRGRAGAAGGPAQWTPPGGSARASPGA